MKKFFTKKRVIWLIVILLILGGIGYFIFGRSKTNNNIQTDTVKRQNLEQTILATGQVVSRLDLSLSFQTSGIVREVKVKEGDKVKTNQALAMLDQTTLQANLTTAQGSLAQYQANYEKLIAGASQESIKVSQAAVTAAQVALDNYNTSLVNTKLQQDTAVQNAYSALLNTAITAVANPGNIDSVVPTISGYYIGTDSGEYLIKVYAVSGGMEFQTSGLEFSKGGVSSILTPMGNRGLYIHFDSLPSSSDSWTVYIPNTYATTYVTNNNAYLAALKTRDTTIAGVQAQINSAQIALEQAQANLNELLASARPAEMDAVKAQILSAQGSVAAAAAAIANSTLHAPTDGTITSVDLKVGELATALKEVMVMQDVNDLHLEADISEANIASVQPKQAIDVTFDALGPDRHYPAIVQTIDPASTIISGVVNFKVTAMMDIVPEIKPGMTANLVIMVAQKKDVLAVPSSAIINQNGKSYVRVIDDQVSKTYHQVGVQTGLQADGGLVEITSGLNEGQTIVIFIKQ